MIRPASDTFPVVSWSRFSRYIDVIDVEQDVNLYDTLYQMYALGDRTGWCVCVYVCVCARTCVYMYV